MKTWFTSRNGAVILTALTILSEAWRGFLDAMFVFPIDINDPLTMQLSALVFALLFGGWAWALALAWQGSNKAMITSFVLNLLVLVAIPISWLFIYCPAACRANAGIFNLANSLNLVLGLLAALSMSFHLRRSEGQPAAVGTSA